MVRARDFTPGAHVEIEHRIADEIVMHLRKLDAVSAVEPGFPHRFLGNIRSGNFPVSFFGAAQGKMDVPIATR